MSSLLACRTWVQRKPHPRLGHLASILLTFFRVLTPRSGGSTLPQPNTGCEPNSELDMDGIVPTVDLTQEDEDRHSQMSDIPLQLSASANIASNNSALVTLSQW